MTGVSRKTSMGPLNGTPAKRLFWSIISDYDLKAGLCELVDNAIDLWMLGGRRRNLVVNIELDVSRQIIEVSDDAGGVDNGNLSLLIAPGGSNNDPNNRGIGIFGVGSKRAGVALGERVEIKTRGRKGASYQIDITKEWLNDTESWDLEYYMIPDIVAGTTKVEISLLRQPFNEGDVANIYRHVCEVYSWFLANGCQIKVNDKPAEAMSFENWAYPPEYMPKEVTQIIKTSDGEEVLCQISSGLTVDRNNEASNYGVYFYCNDRLIVKDLKVREVGYFVTSEAGVPHPDASLARMVVRLAGAAKLMPWNSSKTGINYSHAVFQQIRPTIIKFTTFFSSLSRRLKDDWEKNVFRYKEGAVEEVVPDTSEQDVRLILPPLPKVRKPLGERVRIKNKQQIEKSPWTLGLVESIVAVEILSRQRLETKNRMALVLLDSNFEIALKEFIVHRTDLFPPYKYKDEDILRIFSRRSEVIKEVSAHIKIPSDVLQTAHHYYTLRNKLIHERATVNILDSDVIKYRKAVEKLLKLLFELKF